MNYPQVVIYESDGWLAAQARDLARDSGWLLREPREPDACLSLLREARTSILLLRLERKMIDEFNLLATVRERVPECPVIVFCDAKLDSVSQRLSIAALAYDIGARYVMFPPLTRTLVEDIVAGLMTASIQRSHPPAEAASNA